MLLCSCAEETGQYTESDTICGADGICHCNLGYKESESGSCDTCKYDTPRIISHRESFTWYMTLSRVGKVLSS